jgi:hypothetical protein
MSADWNTARFRYQRLIHVERWGGGFNGFVVDNYFKNIPKDLRFEWKQGGHHYCVHKGEYRFFLLERIRAEVAGCVCIGPAFEFFVNPFTLEPLHFSTIQKFRRQISGQYGPLEYTNGSGDVIELG